MKSYLQKLLNKFKKKKTQTPSLWSAFEQLHNQYEKLNDTIFLLQQLKIENEIFKKQIADFATKAEFALGSLRCTVKLAAEDKDRQELLIKLNAKRTK